MSQFNIIIFSKDRACQLHALLSTWSGEWPVCIVKSSTPEFAWGYHLLTERNNKGILIDECELGGFGPALSYVIDIDRPYTIFFVDDMLIRKAIPWDSPLLTSPLESPEVACVSLRLGPSIRKSYNLRKPLHRPRLDDYTEWFEWEWGGADGEWGYPMSLDAHLFRTKDIFLKYDLSAFRSPNHFESFMAAHPINRPVMACFREGPFTLNVPANQVQSMFRNRTCNGRSAEELNEAFLQGKQIDTGPLAKQVVDSCHVPLKLELTEG